METRLEQFLGFLIELGSTVGLRLIYAIVVLVLGLRLVKYFIKLISKARLFNQIDKSVQSFARSAISIILKFIVFITAASIIGIPITSLLTLFASAGVAIGLALQGGLSNVAGGLMILLFKPFRVGDFIEANSISGTVKDITVFYTIIATPDNKRITLPNGALTNSAVTNYSVEPTRRLDFTFSVAYNSDIDKVKELLIAVAEAHPLVKKDPAPFARLSKQNESSLDFVLRIWCNAEDYWDINFDINEEVKRVFDKNNIEIPFRQLDVHVNNK